MKKLKIILLFSSIINIFLIYFRINKNNLYDISEISIQGRVVDYFIDGNKLEIQIKDNKIIYYFNTKEEKEKFNIEYGDVYKVDGNLYISESIDYMYFLKSKNINYLINAKKIKKVSNNNSIFYSIKNIIDKRIKNNKNYDYLSIFIFGNKKYLDNDIYKTFSGNGISHLFAISGMHISFFTLILNFILLIFIKDKKIVLFFLFLFLFLFCFLTNFSPSVIRAASMFILNNIFRKVKPFHLLIFILNILLLFNPFYIYNVGFIFSFVVSFSLLLFSNKMQNKNIFINIFKISFISFLVGMPISINNFNEINLLSPIINVIFVPFISFIIFPISIISVLFDLTFALNFFLNILELLSCFIYKYFSIKLIIKSIRLYLVFVYYILIYLFLKKDRFIFFLIIIVLIFFFYNINVFNNDLLVTYLNVNQGDSILISMPNNKNNILIDTGGVINYEKEWMKKKNNYSISQSKIITYLKKKGIRKLDYLIITHGDYDHMGESINLVNNFKVENVIFNCGTYNDLEKELIKVLEKKNINYYSCIKELNIDKYKLQFFNTKEYDNENDNSSVIYFNYEGYKFLFMGDAGTQREKDILTKYNLKDIDFLKVGHHGSNTSSSEDFINSINPKYSLISVGKNNRYGHPKDEVLDTLKNSKIYRTDLDGSIEIKLNKNGYKIRTCPP